MREQPVVRDPRTRARPLHAWWAVLLTAIGISGGGVAWLQPPSGRAGIVPFAVAWFLILLALLLVLTAASLERSRHRL